MSKRELIDAIRQVNRTVSPEFLERFNEGELDAYLRRIDSIRPPGPAAESQSLRATLGARQELFVA